MWLRVVILDVLAGALEGVGDLADGDAVRVGVVDVDVALQLDALPADALEGDALQRRLGLGDLRHLLRHEPLGLVHQARHQAAATLPPLLLPARRRGGSLLLLRGAHAAGGDFAAAGLAARAAGWRADGVPRRGRWRAEEMGSEAARGRRLYGRRGTRPRARAVGCALRHGHARTHTVSRAATHTEESHCVHSIAQDGRHWESNAGARVRWVDLGRL
jgi:hypothetical protein